MENLTLKYVVNPERVFNPNLNYACGDNKLHIRFRDYTKPQVISGFINKLTFVLTYLFNTEYRTTMEDSSITDFKEYWEKHLGLFKVLLAQKYNLSLETFEFKPNYTVKKYNVPKRQFGSIMTRSDYLGENLFELVSNEAIDIVLTNEPDTSYQLATKKFKNKLNKKIKKITKPEVVEVNLWAQ